VRKIVLSIVVFLNLNVSLYAQEIIWADGLRFQLGISAYKNILQESLKHPNITYRNIKKIFICTEGSPCLSSPKNGIISLVYHSLISFEEMVDELIEQSMPIENHPLLIPEVKVVLEKRHALATGFFWGKEGYIVTCAHVVAEETSFKIKVLYKNLEFTQEQYTADLIAKDDFSDVALLKLTPSDTENFLSLYSSFPSVLIDEREWSYQKLTPGKSLTLRGFPSYAGGKMMESQGTILDPMASHWSTRLLTIDAQMDKGMSGGTITSQQGYLIGIIFGQMRHMENLENIGALATDFYSDLFLLKQLKEFKTVKEDLIITFDPWGHTVLFKKERNFQYAVRWSTLQSFLTLDDVVYTNAFCGEKGKRRPCGILVWQNRNLELSSLEPQKTIITQINGIDLVQGEPEGSLKKFSWFIRTQNLRDATLTIVPTVLPPKEGKKE